MNSIRLALWLGLVTRPIQLIVFSYLIFKQKEELKFKDRYYTLKILILGLFAINIMSAAVAEVINFEGLFVHHPNHWLGVIYVLTNVITGVAETFLLLAMYLFKLKDEK